MHSRTSSVDYIDNIPFPNKAALGGTGVTASEPLLGDTPAHQVGNGKLVETIHCACRLTSEHGAHRARCQQLKVVTWNATA